MLKYNMLYMTPHLVLEVQFLPVWSVQEFLWVKQVHMLIQEITEAIDLRVKMCPLKTIRSSPQDDKTSLSSDYRGEK